MASSKTIPYDEAIFAASLVYRAVGKLLDIKNTQLGTRRQVILEASDEEENRKAATALADAASVIVYTSPAHLISALAA